MPVYISLKIIGHPFSILSTSQTQPNILTIQREKSGWFPGCVVRSVNISLFRMLPATIEEAFLFYLQKERNITTRGIADKAN